MTIPASDTSRASTSQRATLPAHALHPPVLVADDDDGLRQSVVDILRRAGYQVAEAVDGEQALEAIATGRFAAVVLDIRMPRRDGIAVLDALASPPAVLLTSAFSLDPPTRARIGHKIFAYLRKPVPPDRLLDTLAAATSTASR